MNSADFPPLVDNLQQAGKIHNLQQVCGISGCVLKFHARIATYTVIFFI